MKEPASTPPQIEVRLEGPAVPGRISVDSLTRVARELQTSLRRMLSARHKSTGRFHAEVEQACSLDLTAFAEGSAVLTFEFAGPRDAATLHGDQGVRVAEEMLDTLRRAETNAADWDSGLQPSVIEGWETMTRSLGEGIDSMRITLINGKSRHEARLTPAFRANLRSARSTPLRAMEAAVEGVLWECDWKLHTAMLDEVDGNRVSLILPETLDEKVTELRRQRVRVRGMVESQGGRAVRVTVTSVTAIVEGVAQPDPRYGGFWDNLSIEDLALRQGVQPIQSLDDLACDWPEDESVDEFLAMVREVRGA